MTAAVLACSPAEQQGQPSSSTSAESSTPFARPALHAPFQDGAQIKLDGVLDEALWASAAHAGAFVGARSGKAEPGPLQGKASVFWDEAFLYVAIEVSDATIRGGFPAGAVDPHLWERDTAEIMIDPDRGDNRDYYEIQVGPQGLVFDSQFDEYNKPSGGKAGPFGHEDWSSQMERAVRITGTIDKDDDVDEGYVVESKIPWASFSKANRTPPRHGDVWKMNFYAMQDNGGVAWSPILGPGNFHTAKYFGEVTFDR